MADPYRTNNLEASLSSTFTTTPTSSPSGDSTHPLPTHLPSALNDVSPFGITELHIPGSTVDAIADIVFVHGLVGHTNQT